MFLLVYNHMISKNVVFFNILESAFYICRGGRSSSTEYSIYGSREWTNLKRGPYAFFTSFAATVGLPARLQLHHYMSLKSYIHKHILYL